MKIVSTSYLIRNILEDPNHREKWNKYYQELIKIQGGDGNDIDTEIKDVLKEDSYDHYYLETIDRTLRSELFEKYVFSDSPAFEIKFN